MKEKIEIDLEELQKQRETEIKKSKKFCEARIIIGKGEKAPYAHFQCLNVTSFECALMMKTLDELKNRIMIKDPVAGIIYSKMKVKTSHTIQEDKEGKEQKEDEDSEYSAISRKDNKTKICPKCGNEEAMLDFMFMQNENHIPRID